MTSSACPRCATLRELREGPFYVCTTCRWCWTVSITGKVYVESRWPRPVSRSAPDDLATQLSQRLLRSVEGLSERLGQPWPAGEPPEAQSPPGEELERLRRARDATAADYFNEGLPLAQLREHGVRLPPLDDDEADPALR